MAAGRTSRFRTVSLLVTTVTALAVIIVALWNGGAFNNLICGGDCGAAAIRKPDGLNLDPVDAAVAAPPDVASDLNASAIQSAVADALGSDKLGDHVGFAAVDPRTGEAVNSSGSGAFVPASTTKLLTVLTALAHLDPQQRFVTSVVRSGNQVILVGGGDPYLWSKPPKKPIFAVEADIRTLAKRTAAALGSSGVTSVHLDYNASRFVGPAINPAWEDSYIAERLVAPISALWVDEGYVHGVWSADPPKSAADAFKDKLEDAGIDVNGDPDSVTVPAGATAVADAKSATVARIAEQLISSSDNEAAEVLLRQAAIGAGHPGSFADGVATMQDVLRAKGIDTAGLEIHDGSGLSRHNRITPTTLAQVVAKASTDPRTASLVADLPTANFSGSMRRRFHKADEAKGVVRAKTGTLTEVHSLAGYVIDRNGSPIVFAVMADHVKDVPDLDAEAAMDAVPAALVRCSCSARNVGP
ncbi:MAG: D-alanyl-D-alanine carboxypeptidase/D-alanyl-D-alanine-endopeptidase [Aeromicrobium sp.]